MACTVKRLSSDPGRGAGFGRRALRFGAPPEFGGKPSVWTPEPLHLRPATFPLFPELPRCRNSPLRVSKSLPSAASRRLVQRGYHFVRSLPSKTSVIYGGLYQ